MSKVIEHDGIVKDIRNGVLYVKIEQQTACGACSLQTSCGMIESEDKIVEICQAPDTFVIGEPVTVILEEALGLKAILFGYILPLIILVVTLIASFHVFKKEYLSGLLAIGALIPYYSGLYFMKNKLRSSFRLIVNKKTKPS